MQLCYDILHNTTYNLSEDMEQYSKESDMDITHRTSGKHINNTWSGGTHFSVTL